MKKIGFGVDRVILLSKYGGVYEKKHGFEVS